MRRELRKKQRIRFERARHADIMAIDGTWRRECELLDISDSGALIRIIGSFEGLDLKEFFLLLSSTGLAYRRCELIRVNGNEVGVQFIKGPKPAKEAAPGVMEQR
ncbi:MAG TPA: PilZ domain-containing protein [Xanthobacteraceae bacterium]|nr:PilZ domain-containing protein [Xanthobacteraceae bacterium]